MTAIHPLTRKIVLAGAGPIADLSTALNIVQQSIPENDRTHISIDVLPHLSVLEYRGSRLWTAYQLSFSSHLPEYGKGTVFGITGAGLAAPVAVLDKNGRIFVSENDGTLPLAEIEADKIYQLTIPQKPEDTQEVIKRRIFLAIPLLTAFLATGGSIGEVGPQIASLKILEADARAELEREESLQLGILGYQQGKYQAVIALLTDAIKLKPDFTRAFGIRGLAYEATNQDALAICDFSEVIRLEPKNARAYSCRGVVHAKQNRLDEAIKDLSHAIDLNPQQARFYSNLGVVYAWKNELDRAVDNLSRAIGLDPTWADAYHNRGVAYRLQNRISESAKDFLIYEQLGGEPWPSKSFITWIAFQ